jgi:hypothetical protein
MLKCTRKGKTWKVLENNNKGFYKLVQLLFQALSCSLPCILILRIHEVAMTIPVHFVRKIPRFCCQCDSSFRLLTRIFIPFTQLPIQWVLGALSLGVKWPCSETDHSPPSSAEVKEWVELYLHSPNTPAWRGAQSKHRENFTFYLYLLW